MLTGKDIATLISNPARVNSSHIIDLEELAKKHPYSQLFSLLLLKGMHTSNSLDFDTALKEHSYRIADRKQLYQLIHDFDTSLSTKPTINSDSTLVSPDATTKKVHEIDNDVVGEESEAENTAAESNPTPSYTTKEETEAPPVKQNSVTSDERDPLEENILHHAVASHYQLDALTPEEELALEERQMDLESDNDPKISIDTSEDEVAVEEIAPIPVISDNRLSFTDWLHADANYTPQSDAAHTITGVVEDFSDFDPMKSLYGEVEKPKKEFFSPAKKAKESLSEDKLPVSETLAKVYVMQGNYPKAIQAYNELILAFPEKKIFFANQIEDLKKKLNK